VNFVCTHPYCIFIAVGLALLTTALATFPDGLITLCSEDMRDFFLKTTMAEFAHDDTGTKNFSRRIIRLMMLKDAHTEEDVRHIVEGLNPDFVEAMVRRPMIGWFPEFVQRLFLPEPVSRELQSKVVIRDEVTTLSEEEHGHAVTSTETLDSVSPTASTTVIRARSAKLAAGCESCVSDVSLDRLSSVRHKISQLSFPGPWTPQEVAQRMLDADRRRAKYYTQPALTSLIMKMYTRTFWSSVKTSLANRYSAAATVTTVWCFSFHVLFRSPRVQRFLAQGMELVRSTSKVSGLSVWAACIAALLASLSKGACRKGFQLRDRAEFA